MDIRTCPECHSTMNVKIGGMTLTVICDMCSYSVARSILKDISADQNIYTIDIPLEKNKENIGHVISCIHKKTKETKARLNFNFKKNGRLRYEMASLEAKMFIDEMDKNNVFSTITPEFAFRFSR